MDYFQSLELPPKLSIDLKDLETRFYALSRRWHPDRFARASEEQRRTALDTSAVLNDAYRTLRNPVSRAEYLLSLKGLEPGDAKKVPPELLEEVFELNMALEELRSGDTSALSQLREARQNFQAMLERADLDLVAGFLAWDQTGTPDVLERLRARLNHRKYISNLLRDTDSALENHVSN